MTNILCIGEPLLELSGQGSFHSLRQFDKAYSGDVLNTAVAARRLGSSAGLITRLGNDVFAEDLRQLMLSEQLDPSGIRMTTGATGMVMVAVDDEGQRQFQYYRKGSAASTLDPNDIDEALIKQAQVVYATGVSMAISGTARQAVFRAFELAQKHGVLTAFDPNYRPALWKRAEEAFDAFTALMPLVDLFLPSLPDDVRPVFGFSRLEQMMDYCWFKGIKLVVAKNGADGCHVGYKNTIQHMPAIPGKAMDTTGAGDAFNGGFLHGLIQEMSLMDAAQLGTVTAGLRIRHTGTLRSMPRHDEVYALLGPGLSAK